MAFFQDRVQQRRLRRLPTFLPPVFSQSSIPQHGLWSRTLIFQFRVVVAEVVEVFKIFAHNRVQQRRLRRSLTFVPVEVLTVFSPGRVPQRLPLSMLNFWLVEVFTVCAQDRVFRRFLDLNTAMMLLGVHAEVEDLLEVLKAPSQDRAQQPEVEVVIAGLLGASSCCLRQQGVASSTPTRWPSSVMLRLVALGCTRGRDVLCPDGSRRLHGGLRHRGGGSGVRGLASPHPILGCHYWKSCWVSPCCLRRTVLDSSGLRFRIVRFGWFDSGYSSCVSLRWLLVATSQISACLFLLLFGCCCVHLSSFCVELLSLSPFRQPLV